MPRTGLGKIETFTREIAKATTRIGLGGVDFRRPECCPRVGVFAPCDERVDRKSSSASY